nr:TPA_asm: RNA-dependent RNA polymerase [Beidivirus atrichopogon]
MESLLEDIVRASLNDYSESSYYCPDMAISPSGSEQVIPPYDTNVVNGKVSVEFHNEEDLRSRTSIGLQQLIDERERTFNYLQFQHDFTFGGIWAKDSDVKLKDTYDQLYKFMMEGGRLNETIPEENLGDEFARSNFGGISHVVEYRSIFNHSPDSYMKVAGWCCHIEFATTANDSNDAVVRSYKAKRLKYEFMFKEIINLSQAFNIEVPKIAFFIIVVSPSSVVSNLIIPVDVKIDLSHRMRIGYDIACNLEDRMYSNIRDFKAQKDLEELLTKSQEPLSFNVNTLFTQERYDIAVAPVDETAFQADLTTIIKECSMKQAQEESHLWFFPDVKEKVLLSKLSKQLNSYNDECKILAPDGFNNHLKSVVNLPLICLNMTKANLRVASSSLFKKSIDTDDPTGRCWKFVLENFLDDEKNLEVNQEQQDNYFSDIMFDSEGAEETDYKSRMIDIEDFLKDSSNNPSDFGSQFKKYLEDKREETKCLGPKPKDLRALYNRFRLSIPEDVRVDLAKIGVNGKKFCRLRNEEVEDYRSEKKKPFNIMETNVNDIDTFLNDENIVEWITTIKMGFCETIMNLKRLISKGYSVHENHMSQDYSLMLSSIMSTPIFSYSKLVSDIATELNLSLRQSCKSDEYIIKKVKDYNVLILIKPVNLKSGLFFSLLWDKDDELINDVELKSGNVFRRPSTTSSGLKWTQFISVNQVKLENWILMESRLVALLPYWLEFHGVPPYLLPNSNNDEVKANLMEKCRQSTQMLFLSVITALADKPEIESTFTMFRYAFMKSLTVYPKLPDSYKLVESFKKTPRSRFTVWIMRKIVEFIAHASSGKLKAKVRDLDTEGLTQTTNTKKILDWDGLINPYNGCRLDNTCQVVNLMYIGYIQNKHQPLELNGTGELLEKILTLEEKLTDQIYERIGKENKPLLLNTHHEYNIDFLKRSTDYCFQVYLPSIKGKAGLETRMVEIFISIAKKGVEEVLTTLKASSNFSSDYYEHTDKVYNRLKVIEASQHLVGDSKILMIDLVYDCLKTILRRGNQLIDYFSKEQHNSPREIYTMGIDERVIQWFIEAISRGLCSLFEGETMTHPENKTKLVYHHFNECSRKFQNKVVVTRCDSSDASKWSQNHMSIKFAQMLVRILPVKWHKIVWNILATWDNKFIMIPKQVTDFMHKRDDLVFHNEYMMKFYNSLKGRDSSPVWARANACYIVLRSGMMQGVLHYLSSLFHSVVIKYCEWVQKLIFKRLTGKELLITTMQSSDDSAQICSFGSDEVEENITLRDLHLNKLNDVYGLAIVMNIKPLFSRELAIIDSEKKTTYNQNSGHEFNSAFYFGANRTEPDLKFLYSSLVPTERENIMDRMEEAYTQITSYISAGGTMYSSAFIQLGQALFNYRVLGCSVTTRFSLLANLLVSIPDPNVGFFPLDNCLCTGLFGFKYNVWRLTTRTVVGQLQKRFFDLATTILSPSDEESRLELLKNSMITKHSVIMFGRRKKFFDLLERMELPEEWDEEISKNPELLYRNAKDSFEFKVKCAAKMHSPGVAESLSTGNSTSRIMASSAYVLVSNVMKPMIDWTDNLYRRCKSDGSEFIMKKSFDYENSDTKMCSLMRLALDQTLLQSKHGDLTRSMTDEDLRMIYPYHDDYKDVDKMLESMRPLIFIKKTQEKRRMVVRINLFDSENGFSLPTLTVLKATWFGVDFESIGSRFSKKLIDQTFRAMSRKISWLRDDINETFLASPFTSHLEMFNWFQNLTDKDRKITFVGAPINSNKGCTSTQVIIRQNFNKSYRLIDSVESTDSIYIHQTRSSSYQDLKHCLAMVCAFPYQRDTLSKYVRELLESYRDSLPFNEEQLKSRYNTLSTLVKVADFENKGWTEERVSTVSNMVERTRLGILGFYKIPQKFYVPLDSYRGHGVWTGSFWGVSVEIHVLSVKVKGFDGVETYKTVINYILSTEILEESDFNHCLKEWCFINSIYDRTSGPYSDDSLCTVAIIPPKATYIDKYRIQNRRYINNNKVSDLKIGISLLIIAKDSLIKDQGTFLSFKVEPEFRAGKHTGALLLKVVTNVEDKRAESRGYEGRINQLRGRGTYHYKTTTNLNAPKMEYTCMRWYCQPKDVKRLNSEFNIPFKLSLIEQKWIRNQPLTFDASKSLITKLMLENESGDIKDLVQDLLKKSFSNASYRFDSPGNFRPIADRMKTFDKRLEDLEEELGFKYNHSTMIELWRVDPTLLSERDRMRREQFIKDYIKIMPSVVVVPELSNEVTELLFFEVKKYEILAISELFKHAPERLKDLIRDWSNSDAKWEDFCMNNKPIIIEWIRKLNDSYMSNSIELENIRLSDKDLEDLSKFKESIGEKVQVNFNSEIRQELITDMLTRCQITVGEKGLVTKPQGHQATTSASWFEKIIPSPKKSKKPKVNLRLIDSLVSNFGDNLIELPDGSMSTPDELLELFNLTDHLKEPSITPEEKNSYTNSVCRDFVSCFRTLKELKFKRIMGVELSIEETNKELLIINHLKDIMLSGLKNETERESVEQERRSNNQADDNAVFVVDPSDDEDDDDSDSSSYDGVLEQLMLWCDDHSLTLEDKISLVDFVRNNDIEFFSLGEEGKLKCFEASKVGGPPGDFKSSKSDSSGREEEEKNSSEILYAAGCSVARNKTVFDIFNRLDTMRFKVLKALGMDDTEARIKVLELEGKKIRGFDPIGSMKAFDVDKINNWLQTTSDKCSSDLVLKRTHDLADQDPGTSDQRKRVRFDEEHMLSWAKEVQMSEQSIELDETTHSKDVINLKRNVDQIGVSKTSHEDMMKTATLLNDRTLKLDEISRSIAKHSLNEGYDLTQLISQKKIYENDISLLNEVLKSEFTSVEMPDNYWLASDEVGAAFSNEVRENTGLIELEELDDRWDVDFITDIDVNLLAYRPPLNLSMDNMTQIRRQHPLFLIYVRELVSSHTELLSSIFSRMEYSDVYKDFEIIKVIRWIYPYVELRINKQQSRPHEDDDLFEDLFDRIQ